MAVKLIYEMFAKLLSWMVLHAPSEAAIEIEILVLRHQLSARGTARAPSPSAPATSPASINIWATAADAWARPRRGRAG